MLSFFQVVPQTNRQVEGLLGRPECLMYREWLMYSKCLMYSTKNKGFLQSKQSGA